MEFVRGIAVQVVRVISECIAFLLISVFSVRLSISSQQLVQALGVSRRIFGFHHNDLLSTGQVA